MADIANPRRLSDLKAALRRVKSDDDTLTLESLAALYDVTKPRFVNIRNQISSFPSPIPTVGVGGQHIYRARAAIQALINHETRDEGIAKSRRARTAAILGVKKRGQGNEIAMYKPNDLHVLYRMQQEIRRDEIEQGHYVAVDELSGVVTDMFGLLVEGLAGLANKLDPHGQLDPARREMIDQEGDALILQLHGKMSDMLTRNAPGKRTRKKNSRSRKP